MEKLLDILGKTIEVNSLLVRNTATQICSYAQHPNTLIVDSRAWVQKLYV